MQPFLEAKREKLVELCQAHHVRRLSVFGSALRNDFDSARSDVDLRVEFDDAVSPEDTDYFGLHDKLVKLFGRNVDIISRQIENPYLRQIIDESQVTLYAA